MWEKYQKIADDSMVCVDKLGRQINKNNDLMDKCLDHTPTKVKKDGGWFGSPSETTETTYNKYCENIVSEYIRFNNNIRKSAPALHRLIESVKDDQIGRK